MRVQDKAGDREGWFIPPVVIPIVILLAALAGWYARVSG